MSTYAILQCYMAGREPENRPKRGIDADIWLKQKEKEADIALTPGDHNRTRELLDRLKNNPSLLNLSKGRPKKKKE